CAKFVVLRCRSLVADTNPKRQRGRPSLALRVGVRAAAAFPELRTEQAEPACSVRNSGNAAERTSPPVLPEKPARVKKPFYLPLIRQASWSTIKRTDQSVRFPPRSLLMK